MEGPKLSDSPKNLGMSRADLWAFTALVALDKIQVHSHDLCTKNHFNLTCNDWTTSCWAPFPKFATNLFKTGSYKNELLFIYKKV